MTQPLLTRLTRDLPKLMKAYRERHWAELAQSWLAGTPLVAQNHLEATPDAPAASGLWAGTTVGALLRWAISLTPQQDADSATLLRCFYVDGMTVEAVSERLAISPAAFHKVRQPKAVTALAQALAPLLSQQLVRHPALLAQVIEDRYANLSPPAQRLARFVALFRVAVPAHWVQQALGLLPDEASHLVAAVAGWGLIHATQQLGQPALMAPPEAQAYWLQHLHPPEAQAWHRVAFEYFKQQQHSIEAAHHQLALGAPEFAAQWLITHQTQLLGSNQAQPLLKLIDRIQPQLLQGETWAALKLIEGKAAQALGNANLALEAYRTALASPGQPHHKAEACYRCANALEAQDIDGALTHYQRSIELFRAAAPQDLLHVRAYIDLVWLWLQARLDLPQADSALHDAEALVHRHHAQDLSLKADLHNARARWCHLNGDAALGITHRQQALLAATESGLQERVMKLAHNLGQDYRDAGQYELAMRYLEQSLGLAQTLGNRLLEGVNHETIGGCFFFQHNLPAAIQRYRQAHALFVASGYRDQQGWAAFDLCEAYLQLGELAPAQQAYREAEQLAQQLGLARLSQALAELPMAQRSVSLPEMKLLQRRAQLIELAQQDGSVSNRVYRARVGISQKQAARDLALWVREGTLVVVGQGRSVVYRLATTI
ncbi:MAG: hypothetical protein HC853_02350 [Anaerolineae bacterium]|nr:hypothetical protein [Anaerolineae bacterium]